MDFNNEVLLAIKRNKETNFVIYIIKEVIPSKHDYLTLNCKFEGYSNGVVDFNEEDCNLEFMPNVRAYSWTIENKINLDKIKILGCLDG